MQQFDCPRYIFFENRLSAEKFLSNEINNYIKLKPNSILSFEANENFLSLYELIAKRALETQTSYKDVIFFSPTETCPNNVDIFDLTSYNFLYQNFASKIDLNPNNFYCLFDSNYVQVPNTELTEFDEYLKQNGDIDILLLTVNEDGTLLMNFPQTDLFSKSRIVNYTLSNVDNSNYLPTENSLYDQTSQSQIENQNSELIDSKNSLPEESIYQTDNQQLESQVEQTINNQEILSTNESQPILDEGQLSQETYIEDKNQTSLNSICYATLGLDIIKRSKKIYLLVFGENKNELLSNFFFGSGFDSNLPVSCLRESSNTVVIADFEAAKNILAVAQKN